MKWAVDVVSSYTSTKFREDMLSDEGNLSIKVITLPISKDLALIFLMRMVYGLRR